MKAVIRIWIGLLNGIYSSFKRRPVRKKVTLISRQSNVPSLDFQMLAQALQQRGAETVVLARSLKKTPAGILSYLFHMTTQMKHMAESQVVILDSYCICASVLQHRKTLKIMQIWHAAGAVKMFGKQTLDKRQGSSSQLAEALHMHAQYDYIAAPSETTGRHFARAFGYPMERIIRLGLPRIDYIRKIQDRASAVQQWLPEVSNGKKNILYVPTFRRHTDTSFQDLIDHIDFTRYNLLVHLHPLDQSGRPAVKDGLYYVDGYPDGPAYDFLSIADAVISDYSSFIIEASLCDIPLYLYTYDLTSYALENGLNILFDEEAIGKYQFKEADALANALEEPYDMDALRQFRDKYIQVKDCTENMTAFVMHLLEE